MKKALLFVLVLIALRMVSSGGLVTMEIEIKVPGGVEGDTVRIVTENANSLKFDHTSFERD
jgi:hypothetical protein